MTFFKALKSDDPSALLRLFITGSLAALLLSLGTAAIVLSSIFVKKEQHRAQLALEQLGQSIEAQYRSIAEEMWTGNYESIGLRVHEIARHHGDSRYYVVLTDVNSQCRFAVGYEIEGTEICDTPDELKLAAPRLAARGILKQVLQVDEESGSYTYMAPLYVGTVLKGFIYASFSDPYEFFRGNPVSLMAEFFLPALFTVLVLWFLWLLISRTWILRPYLERVMESQKKEALGAMASKVAHDIRSPLSALNMVVKTLGSIPEEKRQLIEKAARRINDIANDLLATHRKDTPVLLRREISTKRLSDLLNEICEEKKLVLQNRPGVRLVLDLSTDHQPQDVSESKELERVLSNLIDNAAEAIEGSGLVQVKLYSSGNDSSIVISDSGKGMPPELLERLGHEPVSYGKTGTNGGGSGLGVFNAKKVVTRMGGRLSIQSRQGAGTIVSIHLPWIERAQSVAQL